MESVLSRPLIPCPRVDAPVLPYDANMAVIISEETADASAWAVTYRGLIRTSHSDMQILEEKAPLWLLDFLLGGRIPFKDPVKIVSRDDPHVFASIAHHYLVFSHSFCSLGWIPYELALQKFQIRASIIHACVVRS